MRAQVLEGPLAPLVLKHMDLPDPGPGQLLLSVRACGVCRTDLHLVDGELPDPKLPVVPGHEVVGTVRRIGAGVSGFSPGQRVGVPWLGFTCGTCRFCRSERENLCVAARFTGYTLDGGYAEELLADARYCFSLPEDFDDLQAAPLLCAGLIGYRALRIADANFVGCRVGIYGFGAAAHIVTQILVHEGREVFAFVRPGNSEARAFALELGAVWAGDSHESPPTPLDSAIIFAPVGSLVPLALAAIEPGGRVVCAGIHMSDIPAFNYDLLWRERQLVSVANLTRQDAIEFLPLAASAGVKPSVTALPLESANEALRRLRIGDVRGALVLVP